MNITQLKDRPFYYLYDGINSLSESVWIIISYPVTSRPRNLRKPTLMPIEGREKIHNIKKNILKKYFIFHSKFIFIKIE